MTKKEIVERRILLKRQLIELTMRDIASLRAELRNPEGDPETKRGAGEDGAS